MYDKSKPQEVILIEKITNMSPTAPGDFVAVECIVEGTQRFYGLSPENALQMAISLIAGAKACGYIQLASSEEKASPDFESHVKAMITDAMDEMTDDLVGTSIGMQ